MVSDTDPMPEDDSRRHLTSRAAMVALLMRHCAVVIVATIVLAGPGADTSPAGKLLAGFLLVWSTYRLLTRSSSALLTAVDYAITITVCLTIPALVTDPQFHTSNSAPVAIAGTAVISFAVALPARLSLAMTLGIAASYAVGAAGVLGWPHVLEVFNLYYFAIQWATASGIRLLILRVADAVDASRADRQAAEVTERVTVAVRDYDREQLRLLHDTVASTLLMVGQGTALPQDRLAAQASRDLAVLDDIRASSPPTIDLVAALREAGTHIRTPVRYRGAQSLFIDGSIGALIAAAAREAMTNVDRHAQANTVTVEVDTDRVRVSDDGVGFDPDTAHHGHGTTESILARMHQLGGTAHIDSAPGQGTIVELCWPPTDSTTPAAQPTDPDRLITGCRVGYSVALTVYAMANLAVMTAPSLSTGDHTMTQMALAAVAALSTLSALPALLDKRGWPPWPAILALLVIALAQSTSVPTDELGTQSHWSQSTIGWCLLPLVLRLPLRNAAALLCFYWIAMAANTLSRDLSPPLVANVGLGTASILAVQLFALIFYHLIAGAAKDARNQTDARSQSVARDRINAALQAEYQRRFADLAAAIRPLLITMSQASRLDPTLRRRAHTEHQRLRALFDQSSPLEHHLLQQLRPLIDAAAQRGVEVSVHVDAALPDIDTGGIQRITGALAPPLTAATAAARITLTGSVEGIEASILATGSPNTQTVTYYPDDSDDDLQVTTLDDGVWLTIRHRQRKGTRHDAHIDTPPT